MFNRLLESNARRQRRAGGMIVSTGLHLIVIALAVRATGLTAETRPKTEPVLRPIFLGPQPDVPPRSPTPARRQNSGPSTPSVPAPPRMPPVISTDIPSTIPPVDAMTPILEDAFNPTTRISGTGQPAGSPNGSERPAFSEWQVEKAVLALPGTTPRYPSMLQSAGLEGDVRAQFVVDTLGRVEPGSFRALESTHALFTDAVRDALGRARFTPAEAGGHKVRQLVEQVFTFRISR